jgi:hypothetical protein
VRCAATAELAAVKQQFQQELASVKQQVQHWKGEAQRQQSALQQTAAQVEAAQTLRQELEQARRANQEQAAELEKQQRKFRKLKQQLEDLKQHQQQGASADAPAVLPGGAGLQGAAQQPSATAGPSGASEVTTFGQALLLFQTLQAQRDRDL